MPSVERTSVNAFATTVPLLATRNKMTINVSLKSNSVKRIKPKRIVSSRRSSVSVRLKSKRIAMTRPNDSTSVKSIYVINSRHKNKSKMIMRI